MCEIIVGEFKVAILLKTRVNGCVVVICNAWNMDLLLWG